jgi:hypothetical protein
MDDAAFVYWPDSSDGDMRAPADIGAFVDRMSELAGETRRRLRVPAAPHVPRRARSHDGSTEPPKIDLVLYMSPASEKCRKALRAVQDVLEEYVAAQVRFSTCDLSARPQDGDTDAVLFTPTLVKQGPGPRTSIIGNLEQRDVLKDLLDASGVDRRRWDD